MKLIGSPLLHFVRFISEWKTLQTIYSLHRTTKLHPPFLSPFLPVYCEMNCLPNKDRNKAHNWDGCIIQALQSSSEPKVNNYSQAGRSHFTTAKHRIAS